MTALHASKNPGHPNRPMTCHMCGDPPTKFFLMQDDRSPLGVQALMRRAYCGQCFWRSSVIASMIGRGKATEASDEEELLVQEIMDR